MKTLNRAMEMQRAFPRVVDVLNPGVSGNVEIRHFDVDKDRAYIERCIRNEVWTKGKYMQLDIDGVGWMFDTPHEKWLNRRVLEARRDVLIGGLGLGMILHPLLRKAEIERIDVIEMNEDVIRLVLPSFNLHPQRHKLNVIHGDAKTFDTARRYDFVWLDCVPAYGWDMRIMQMQEGWKDHYRKFQRNPRAFNVWHWGWEENVEYHLRRGDDDDGAVFLDHMPIGPPHALMQDISKKHLGERSATSDTPEIASWGVHAR
jgi:hypothetical protein